MLTVRHFKNNTSHWQFLEVDVFQRLWCCERAERHGSQGCQTVFYHNYIKQKRESPKSLPCYIGALKLFYIQPVLGFLNFSNDKWKKIVTIVYDGYQAN